MTLFKTTLWTGFSTFIKVISTYLLWKIIAVYTGPTGMAVLEQFQNFIQICRSLSCSLSQGIIKYVSEYKDNEEKKAKILSSALGFYFIISIIVTFLLILFSKFISEKVFSSFAYQKTIIILAISITLYSLNNLLLSILNGELEIKKYVSCNVANTILSFIITGYLVIYHGIQGGVIGLSLNQSIALALTIYLVIKSKWFNFHFYLNGIDKESIKKLFKYAIVSFVPILMVPISLMISRQWIAHELSWQEAGYWQGIMKLSDGYLILMDLMISVYLIPKLSSIRLLSEFKAEVINCYRLIIPCVFLGLSFIFLFKKQIVTILFTKEFYPMLILFKYQMMGDMARVGTWLLANIMAAKAMIKILVVSEITFNLSYIFLTMIFVHYYGLIGTSIAFAINSLIYFSSMIFFTVRCVRNGSFQLINV
ncbi:MAG: Lipopolysaccharide biosynthesis protein [uncultured bacterium]|nr:MAG: Lipopolysaccharide biosynthesis protein [uncultured bacterium]